MKKAKQKVSKPQAMVHALVAVPALEDVRERAHQICLARGNVAGRELDDWLQAERELKAAKNPSAI